MSALEQAKAHLAKAREFLEAAHLSNDLELYSAATSNAVIAGINAKDALCLKLTGRTGKTDNHQEALAALRVSGAKGRELEPTLARLLKLKARSQYQSAPVAATDAAKAVDWAGRMVDGAIEAVIG
jgi:uncharacterized protein (UPF0332 family)